MSGFEFIRIACLFLCWFCIVVQVWVCWAIWSKLAFYPKKKQKSADEESKLVAWPAVSVIICARNEAPKLQQFLPAFCNQTYSGDWELLLVNDASTDETPMVMSRFAAEFPNRVRLVSIGEKKTSGKKHALQQGIALSRHPIILLSDADCQPSSINWMSQMIKQFRESPHLDIVLGYAPNFPVNPPTVSSLFFRYETAFTALQYFSWARAGMPYMGVGRNLAFKRTVFQRVGGFLSHAHLISGDDDLLVNAAANAENTAICLHSDAFVYSAAPKSLTAWLQQKRRHLSTGPNYRRQHQWVLGILAFSEVGIFAFAAMLWIFGWGGYGIFGAIVFRCISLWWFTAQIFTHLKEPELRWKIPVLHLILVVYWAIWVPWVLWFSKKKVIWKA